MYSLSPDRRMFSHPNHDSDEKVENERKELNTEIENRISNLSQAEKNRYEQLVEQDGDLDALSCLALKLLSGKRLEPFAVSLMDWSFAHAINGSFYTPTKEFLALIGFNRLDWAETRHALIKECESLLSNSISETGKWAILRVLRATGDSEDDKEAALLYEDLTNEGPKVQNTDRMSQKVDPCDPLEKAPTDISKIAGRYQNLDVSILRRGMNYTIDDSFFVDDRPSLARFELNIAIEKHSALIDDVIKRTGMPLRQGLLEISGHNSLVTREQANSLISKWKNAQKTGKLQGLSIDETSMLQYELIISFPFIEANEQFFILMEMTEDQSPLLELINKTKKPNAETINHVLKKPLYYKDEYKMFLMLAIIASTGAEISNKVCAFVCSSITSKSERLRCNSLRLAAQSGNYTLLKAVVRDWKYSNSAGENSSESWYGSLALLKAAKAKLVDECTVLDRISPHLYGRSAIMFKGSAVREVVRRIDISIRSVVNLPLELVAPEIEMVAKYTDFDDPVLFSITEREKLTLNPEQIFQWHNESSDDFYKRQRKNHESFFTYCEKLTIVNARMILYRLTQEEFSALAANSPEVINQWYDLFMELNDARLPAVHNLLLLLANSLMETQPDKSAALYRRVMNSEPLVRFTYGNSGVDLGSISIWRGGRSTIIDTIRSERLDRALNDQAIAVEVLSALIGDHGELLDDYVEDKLMKDEPSEIARGIMVAGYCDQSLRNERILDRFKDTAGLLGKAYASAIKAYRYNIWARHWFSIMCDTEDPIVFWQSGVLFTQCVDGRFQIWKNSFNLSSELIVAFAASLNHPLERRCKKVAIEREKRLFGVDAPDSIFIMKNT